jgi:PAS domain-containing protein
MRGLRERDEKLVTILATIDNVVWSIAEDTYETLYLNPAAERIYGRTASTFYADPKLFMDIVHPEDRPRVAQFLPELIEKGSRLARRQASGRARRGRSTSASA